jgi:hypothetical protein
VLRANGEIDLLVFSPDSTESPDILTRDHDGNLLAFRNGGKFEPNAPLGPFEEPIFVGVGLDQYDVIS